MQARLLSEPSSRRITLRLLSCAGSALVLSVLAGTPHGLTQILARVGLCVFAGAGASFVALFPLCTDTTGHRGLFRFVREELARLEEPR